MHIGIPKEIKTAERRVALTPDACASLISAGYRVHLEKGAGQGAGFPDEAYHKQGVAIEPNAESLYAQAGLIVKVKEPQAAEIPYLRSDHVLFCFLHLAANPTLAQALRTIGLTAVAFETVEENGHTPLLAPMSAIAGRLSVQLGSYYLHAAHGGRGTLLGGTADQSAGVVTIIGAGVAGTEAAILADDMGAHVTVLDINGARLHDLKNRHPEMEVHLYASDILDSLLPTTDLLIGAVYRTGEAAPRVVSESQVRQMPKGAVIVDIAIDQGGCIATSRPTTYDHPTYVFSDVIHCAITNLPAAVPRTASEVLSAAILPYVAQLASGQWTPVLRKALAVGEK